jgi:hypothetical protein
MSELEMEVADQLIVALQRAVDNLFEAARQPSFAPYLAKHFIRLVETEHELSIAMKKIAKANAA